MLNSIYTICKSALDRTRHFEITISQLFINKTRVINNLKNKLKNIKSIYFKCVTGIEVDFEVNWKLRAFIYTVI